MRAVAPLASALLVVVGLAGAALAGDYHDRRDDWREAWRHDHRWHRHRAIVHPYPPPFVIGRPIYPVALLPENEIFRRLHAQGYRPISHVQPYLSYLRVYALNPWNRQVLLTVSPTTGDVLSWHFG